MSRSAASPRVLVVGDVIDDLIVRPRGPVRRDTDTPATVEPRPGGSGANQAAWLAAAGSRVRFAGRVGADDVARHRAEFARHGVEAHLAADPDRPTGTIVVLVGDDGSRTMLTDRGANLGLTPADLPDVLLDDVELVHVSGYALFDPSVRVAVLDLIDRVRARGLAWSVDPASAGFLDDVGPEAFLDWTAGVDVLLPNRDEGARLAAALAGPPTAPGPEAVARTLTRHASVVAMTLGGDGAVVAARGHEPARVAARPASVVDTTGAGDAFAGGFLTAWLRGRDPVDAAAAGARAAALAVARTGARPGPGDRDGLRGGPV